MIRYVFFGTPDFAATVLKRAIDAGYPPLALVANPDRPAGRKKILTAPPTKLLVQETRDKKHVTSNIEILQPEKLDSSLISHISSLKPDLGVVAAYAKIIPRAVLELFPRGIIGVHPSLLPRLRGATPIQSAILTGEPATGVTLYQMDEHVDHGPIIAVRSLASYNPDSATTSSLTAALAICAGDLLAEMLPHITSGKVHPELQNEARATFTKKFSPEDAFVPPEELLRALSGDHPDAAQNADRLVRALNPEPGVWTLRGKKRLKLLTSEVLDGTTLRLIAVQEEGKKPRSAETHGISLERI